MYFYLKAYHFTRGDSIVLRRLTIFVNLFAVILKLVP